MNAGSLYELRLAGDLPVWAELVQPIGEEELMHVHIGALVLVVGTDLAEDLADSLIEAVADRSAPVTLR